MSVGRGVSAATSSASTPSIPSVRPSGKPTRISGRERLFDSGRLHVTGCRLAQQSCSQNAFYLDDQMSGYDFYGNTCAAALSAVALCDALGLSDQRRCLGAE